MFDTEKRYPRPNQDSIFGGLHNAFSKSKIKIPPNIINTIGDLLEDLLDASPGKLTRKKLDVHGDLFSGDSSGSSNIINIYPGNNSSHILTNTLVVYCTGSDNLHKRLDDTLSYLNRIEVSNYNHVFDSVTFITNKWDESVFNNNNYDRYEQMMERSERSSRSTGFCFMLFSIGGISHIFDI